MNKPLTGAAQVGRASPRAETDHNKVGRASPRAETDQNKVGRASPRAETSAPSASSADKPTGFDDFTRKISLLRHIDSINAALSNIEIITRGRIEAAHVHGLASVALTKINCDPPLMRNSAIDKLTHAAGILIGLAHTDRYQFDAYECRVLDFAGHALMALVEAADTNDREERAR